MNEAIDIEKLAEAVAAQVSKRPPFEKQIYDAQQAADYLKVSRHYLLHHMRDKPGFPKPIAWSGKKRVSKPKWFAKDLYDYARKSQ